MPHNNVEGEYGECLSVKPGLQGAHYWKLLPLIYKHEGGLYPSFLF